MTPKRQIHITATNKEITARIIGPVTKPSDVLARLDFAHRRLADLQELNNGDLVHAPADDRQQLVQEFLFHLVGSIDFLAQVVNSERQLGLDLDRATPSAVCARLSKGDSVRDLLTALHPSTGRKATPPADWDSDSGCHYRIVLLRNRVCHHGNNPFFYRWGRELRCHLFIDPRDPDLGHSTPPAVEDLQRFWGLVNDKCRRVIDLL